MGIDEIHLGKKQRFLTVVTNLETGEPLWFGRERKKETLDEFFQQQVSAFPAKPATVGTGLPHRLRQVSHHAARRSRRR
jgi:hypothetical protein